MPSLHGLRYYPAKPPCLLLSEKCLRKYRQRRLTPISRPPDFLGNEGIQPLDEAIRAPSLLQVESEDKRNFSSKSHDGATPHAPTRYGGMAPVAVKKRQLAPVDRALSPCADELHRLVGVISTIDERNGDENWASTEAGNAVDSQNASFCPGFGSELSPLAQNICGRGFPIWKGELVDANASSNHWCIVVGMGAGPNQIGDTNLAHCS